MICDLSFPTWIESSTIHYSRCDPKIALGPPDLEARVELLKFCMTDRPQEKMDFLELAQECEYYTSAEIENLVNVAASLAAKNQRFISAADQPFQGSTLTCFFWRGFWP